MSEISLLLDTYDDIFSDFDPRPYSQRALSEDFLNETKKASKEKTSGSIELKFLVPAHIRNLDRETNIKKRLREHFKKHHMLLRREVLKIRERGILLILVGTVLTLAATYISNFSGSGFVYKYFFVLLEPAGWFITWTGFDHIFSARKQRENDIEFYEKMSKCEVRFYEF